MYNKFDFVNFNLIKIKHSFRHDDALKLLEMSRKLNARRLYIGMGPFNLNSKVVLSVSSIKLKIQVHYSLFSSLQPNYYLLAHKIATSSFFSIVQWLPPILSSWFSSIHHFKGIEICQSFCPCKQLSTDYCVIFIYTNISSERKIGAAILRRFSLSIAT